MDLGPGSGSSYRKNSRFASMVATGTVAARRMPPTLGVEMVMATCGLWLFLCPAGVVVKPGLEATGILVLLGQGVAGILV